jgi:hypothetical protein
VKRVLLLVFSGIAALVAIGCFFSGLALVLVFGGDGWVESSSKRVTTDTYALVSEPADINNGPSDNWFDVSVRLRAEPVQTTGSGEDVFIGVGETADVDRYLARVAHDVVTDLEWGEPGVLTTTVPGDETPEPPGSQGFWIASASGPGEQALEWDLEDGSYRLVVMNADGSQSVDVRGKFGFRMPFLFGLGVALLVAAMILAAVAVLLLVLGIRARPAAASAPPGPPPAQWGGAPPVGTSGGTPSGPWSQPPGQSP